MLHGLRLHRCGLCGVGSAASTPRMSPFASVLHAASSSQFARLYFTALALTGRIGSPAFCSAALAIRLRLSAAETPSLQSFGRQPAPRATRGADRKRARAEDSKRWTPYHKHRRTPPPRLYN